MFNVNLPPNAPHGQQDSARGISKGESSESGMKLDDTLQFSRTFDGSALLSQEQLSPFNRKDDGS